MTDNKTLLADIESLLGQIHEEGLWEDEHNQMLARLRTAKGDKAKSAWEWWYLPDSEETPHDEHRPAPAGSTRKDVIELAKSETTPGFSYFIIQARLWNDEVEGDENCYFAETRNKEVFQGAGQ